MPAGRPSKYQDAYCNEIIAFMASGYSLTAAAGHIGVSRETIYEWERSIPEFSDAVKKARAKRTMKLEGDLLEAPSGPLVTSRIFALKNACPEEWREKVVQEHVGKDDTPLDGNATEIARRVAFLLAKATQA